jgi:hypothetical protein
VLGLLVVGAIGGVWSGLIPNPFRLSAAQIAQAVDPSVVTVKADLFRDGNTSGFGFAYGRTDHILINARLLTHAVAVTASDRSGKSYRADVLGSDTTAGVAELEISGFGGPPLTRAGQEPAVGADVYLPHGPSGPLAHGIVTRQDRGLIQTNISAAAPDGGQPLIDGNGQVVGLVEAATDGLAVAIPTAAFDARASGWAKSNQPISIGPPLVTETARSLVLGSPGAGWKRLTGAAYDNGTAWHSAWEWSPTYTYGGMTVDIDLVVFATLDAAPPEIPSDLANATRNGFSPDGSLTGFGDEGMVLQKSTQGVVIYELLWRDRNCVVILYLSAAKPPPPQFSLAAAIGLATAQERPIGASLGSY